MYGVIAIKVERLFKHVRNYYNVFIDANVIISAGKPPGGPEMARVIDLVDAGIVSILTTDLSVQEIVKKHTSNQIEIIKDICRPHFRNAVFSATGASIPEIQRRELEQSVREGYAESVRKMFESMKAETLNVDSVRPSVIFSSYASGEGFFAGNGKKDQFPDAFIFECINSKASIKCPVIIVSQDQDFLEPVNNHEYISLVKSLPELFAVLGFEIEAPEVGQFLADRNESLVEIMSEQLNDLDFYDQDVGGVEIYDVSVDELKIDRLVSFKPVAPGDNILVVCSASVNISASFSHPNWDDAMYDSEEKVLIPFENVDGETQLEMDVEFSISISVDGDGAANDIVEIIIRDPESVSIELYPFDD